MKSLSYKISSSRNLSYRILLILPGFREPRKSLSPYQTQCFEHSDTTSRILQNQARALFRDRARARARARAELSSSSAPSSAPSSGSELGARSSRPRPSGYHPETHHPETILLTLFAHSGSISRILPKKTPPRNSPRLELGSSSARARDYLPRK